VLLVMHFMIGWTSAYMIGWTLTIQYGADQERCLGVSLQSPSHVLRLVNPQMPRGSEVRQLYLSPLLSHARIIQKLS
jgi:hypothetical protein